MTSFTEEMTSNGLRLEASSAEIRSEGGKMILVLVLPFFRACQDIFLNHGPSSLSTEKTIAVQHDFNTKSWTNVG